MSVVGIDSPTGGLNAFDSVDNMPPTDAITLDNWVPRSGFCQSRPGEVHFTEDLGAPVESLLAYKGIASRVMLAATGGQLLDVTAGGAGVLLAHQFEFLQRPNIQQNDRQHLSHEVPHRNGIIDVSIMRSDQHQCQNHQTGA